MPRRIITLKREKPFRKSNRRQSQRVMVGGNVPLPPPLPPPPSLPGQVIPPAPQPPVEKPSGPAVYVFHHIWCNVNTPDIVKDQHLRIIFSGLYDVVTAVYCFLAGPTQDEIDKVKDVIAKLGKKFRVEAEGPGDKSYERFTLLKIPKYVKAGDKFLYIHSKGVNDIGHFTGKPAEKNNIYWWRTWMEYYLVRHFKKCLTALDNYDVVGINYSTVWIGPHFSGNFWWATAKYYLTLPNTIADFYTAPESYILSKGGVKWLDIDAKRHPENGGLYSDPFYTKEYI